MALRLILLTLVLVVLPIAATDVMGTLQRQALRTAASYKPGSFPDATADGKWHTGSAGGWTAGFFPGLLWQLYGLTNNETFKTQALRWTAPLAVNRHNTRTHDVGFMVFDSFGKGVELGGMGEDYSAIVMDTAHALSTRFNPRVGCTQSWSAGHHCRLHPSEVTEFPVIIDNMMNLELLLWAGRHSGNSTLTNIALAHANTTSLNHVRADGSTFHVVDYNPSTGAVKEKCTAQGFRDNSTWSRGQAWCVYGFTMVNRYSPEEHYLQTAERCADYFIQRLGPSSVPLWDFDWTDGNSTHFEDASAAAIAASGLLELSSAIKDPTKRTTYKQVADSILEALTGPVYFGDYETTEGIVLHATANFATNGSIDCSLVYGGYYLAEGLSRQAAIGHL